jgi:hypothetical protein
MLPTDTDWDTWARKARRSVAQAANPGPRAWLIGLAAEYRRLAKLTTERRAAHRDGGPVAP